MLAKHLIKEPMAIVVNENVVDRFEKLEILQNQTFYQQGPTAFKSESTEIASALSQNSYRAGQRRLRTEVSNQKNVQAVRPKPKPIVIDDSVIKKIESGISSVKHEMLKRIIWLNEQLTKRNIFSPEARAIAVKDYISSAMPRWRKEYIPALKRSGLVGPQIEFANQRFDQFESSLKASDYINIVQPKIGFEGVDSRALLASMWDEVLKETIKVYEMGAVHDKEFRKAAVKQIVSDRLNHNSGLRQKIGMAILTHLEKTGWENLC